MKTSSSYTGRLFLIHLYFTVIYAIPAPVNFTIWSHNFRHILHWNYGVNSPPQSVFNLQRFEKGKQTEHLNIRNTTMDVSEACQDIYIPCTFLIWASLDNMNSSVIEKKFIPYEDTIIGPPVIFLSGCGDCLNISISLPNESRKDDKLRRFYNSVSYSISWKKHGNNEVREILRSQEPSKQYVLENLQPGVQYCVKVLPQINSNQNTQPSSWQCEYTSKEEAQRVLYFMSWLLGATLSGSCVMMLAWILVYTGFLCKPKNPPLKSLSNIVPATYLIPEQTLSESLSLTEVQLIHLSYDTTENNSQLKNPEKREYEGSVLKSDTEDEEDSNDEDEVKCVYMSCEIDDISCQNNSTKKDIVSALPFNKSSIVCYTKELAMEKIQYDDLKSEKELLSELFEEGHGHLEVTNTQLKTEGNEKGSTNTPGNINLFSVTVRTFGAEDDLDKEDVYKPLLPKLFVKTDKWTEELLPVSNKIQISIPIETGMKTDDLIHLDSQNDLVHVCSLAHNVETNPDTTMSAYMMNHIGKMHDQNKDLLEETNCDTSYITR